MCGAMQLRAGLTFTVAPRFYNNLRWAERLQINGGVHADHQGVSPRQDWRSLSDQELSIVVPEAATSKTPLASADLTAVQVGVFTIPDHLREGWWVAIEDADAPDGNAEGYQKFVAATIAFLQFKQLPLPERCRFDLLARRPGQAATGAHTAEGLGGLTPDTDPGVACRLVAAINLGEELTRITLINLELSKMIAMLGERGIDAVPATAGHQFLSVFPTYPLVRVVLDPCEGLWLPETAVILGSDTQGKQEPDIVLLVREEPC